MHTQVRGFVYCYIWSCYFIVFYRSDDGGCLLYLDPAEESCVPVQHAQETFFSSHQQTKNILKITGCGCKHV